MSKKRTAITKNTSTCAGLWSDDKIVVVLANVTSVAWRMMEGHGFGSYAQGTGDAFGVTFEDTSAVNCSREQAHAFVVYSSDDTWGFTIEDYRKAEIDDLGTDFIHCLSLYWETRL